MRKQLATAPLLLLGLSGLACADTPDRGAYFGGSYGTALLQDDGFFTNYAGFDDTDKSYNFFVGYRFFRYFGVEGRYSSLGSFSDGFDSVDVSAVSAHAVGIAPFGQSGWELFGHAGFADLTQEVAGFYEEDDFAGAAGIGVRWNIQRSFAVALQISAFAWQNDDFDYTYDFGVGSQQLSVQFNF